MMPYYYGGRMSYNVRRNDGGVHGTDTDISHFFQRLLWQDIIGVLKWNLPRDWDYDYFTYTLYFDGYITVVNTDMFGVIPVTGRPMGYNVQYQPTHMVISNPLLKGMLTPRIGTQCAVIRLTPDWTGVEDIITYYADLMATACSAIGVNLINSKLAYVLISGNTAQAETLRGIYGKIASGEPAVIIDKDVMDVGGNPKWVLFDTNVSQHYITDKLLVDLEKIHNQFRTWIGIPNGNTEKKERMIVDEVNSNNNSTKLLTDTMLDRLNRGIDMAKKLFGLPELSVDWRYKDEELLSEPDGGTARRPGRDGEPAPAGGS